MCFDQIHSNILSSSTICYFFSPLSCAAYFLKYTLFCLCMHWCGSMGTPSEPTFLTILTLSQQSPTANSFPQGERTSWAPLHRIERSAALILSRTPTSNPRHCGFRCATALLYPAANTVLLQTTPSLALTLSVSFLLQCFQVLWGGEIQMPHL